MPKASPSPFPLIMAMGKLSPQLFLWRPEESFFCILCRLSHFNLDLLSSTKHGTPPNDIMQLTRVQFQVTNSTDQGPYLTGDDSSPLTKKSADVDTVGASPNLDKIRRILEHVASDLIPIVNGVADVATLGKNIVLTRKPKWVRVNTWLLQKIYQVWTRFDLNVTRQNRILSAHWFMKLSIFMGR